MLAFVDQMAWLRRQDFTLSCLGVLHSSAAFDTITHEVKPQKSIPLIDLSAAFDTIDQGNTYTFQGWNGQRC